MVRRATHFRIQNRVKMKYKLSILIPTLSNRTDRLKSLLDRLNYQIQFKAVEVLWLGDNQVSSVGAKRNTLLDIAKGDFVAFVDDDDEISDNYIEALLKAIDENPDKVVICFHGTQSTDGKQDLPFQYNIKFGRHYKCHIDGVRWKVMLPDHLCCWRRDRITERFPDKNLGEDHAWSAAMARTYREEDQVLITDTLYHYNYDRTVSETRRR